MIIGLTILGIFILYWRCLNYYFLIDDIVRRWGYLYIVPETSPSPLFYSTKPHAWRHLFPIIMHAINVYVIYVLFGWVPAALFAFSPLSVPGTAWITGSYYAVTAFFTLTAYFFLSHFPNIFGAALGMTFFTAALGSTITCLGFPFIFLFFNPIGLCLFWPVVFYLKGRRFGKGYNIRDMGKKDFFNLGKIPVMTKVIAYYIYKIVFPYRLAFFHKFGESYSNDQETRKDLESVNGWFALSFLSIIAFVCIGWQFSPLGVVWFLCTIAPFSQFKVLGQFVAERYVYLPLIGWSLILGGALAGHPILLTIVLSLYIARSHFYIPTYEKIESLYEDGIRNIPNCLANYANLGERYIHVGRLLEGHNVLARGLKVEPDNFLCFCNTAAFWTQTHGIDQGIYYTEKGIDLGMKKSSWMIVHAMKEQMKALLKHQKLINRLERNEPDFDLKLQKDKFGGISWAGHG